MEDPRDREHQAHLLDHQPEEYLLASSYHLAWADRSRTLPARHPLSQEGRRQWPRGEA